MAVQERRPYQPSLLWRATSATEIGMVGLICRSFLFALNTTEVHGLDRFLKVLDSRKDEKARTRGLITVSNHVSVLDDPIMWGVLPNKYFWDPNNMRWSLGSYDICFRNKLFETFFSYGNTLPTHRAAYSKHGGLFQPTMTQVIRLLSDPHSQPTTPHTATRLVDHSPDATTPPTDPFTSNHLTYPSTYSTTGTDTFPAPSYHPSRRYSWIHIFPEGMIHQHPAKVMRYFKWGVARLILEAEPTCPDLVPIWIDGTQDVMPQDRGWPRPVPRVGKKVSVTFGEVVDGEGVFGGYRERWRSLKERARRRRVEAALLGELREDELKYGAEAEQLRIEVTMAVRNEVLKVRRACGLPDEDPKRGLAETYRAEGGREASKDEGRKPDGSIVKDGL
ncbi:hypothetical protein BAUCODRAFT_572705 [Baudoinia panamericana UAMH 10762]|uniref:Tafazzin family protein n=1 Tax=Baudoinia panamericana (strain UAMH 10762) TaxID=717646 RepID=M2NH19_BAUPA|nr:uncharacterized protein BAUCODRAFT_572705 [Baudoinia panamericana UAMH 10762]EMC98619.1 hypothetical protein BAUCODRAFT_572705 [Baudoinia panamericana UAMH 10762]